MVREKSITDKVIDELNNHPNIWVRKRHTTGMSGTIGWPDITGIIAVDPEHLNFGIRIEIEMKKPGKTPTQNQFSRLRRFRKLGAIAFWANSQISVMTQFQYWCKKVGNEQEISYEDLTLSGNVFVVQDL